MDNKNVLVMLAEGFEEIEALTVVDLLRRAGIPVLTVSVSGSDRVCGAHGIPVIADCVFDAAEAGKAGMIVLPGGMPGTLNLKNCSPLTDTLKKFRSEDKPLAAICAAPMVLASCGILEGKKATIYEGMEAELKGAVHTKGNVVRDGNIITSKGPGTAMDFGLALIGFLCGDEKEAEIKAGLLYRN